MKTLSSSCSKAIIDKHRESGFSSFKDVSLDRAEVGLFPSKKFVRIRLLHLVSVQHRRLQPVLSSSASSPDLQVDLVAAETHPEEKVTSKTTHVKFQLQKGCSFGEHFFIVGDHPIFGLWDPESAIPLNWSEGHVWTVELDIPVGKTIQFKFLLKNGTGDLLWQPGPDRIFKSWETEKTIVVCEDWEDAECQKVIEEEQSAHQGAPVIDSELPIVAENLAPAKEEIVPEIELVSGTKTISNPEKELFEAIPEELITGTGNGAPSPEKSLAFVAENISYPAEDSVENANSGELGVNISNTNALVAEDLDNIRGLETSPNPPTADVEGSLVAYEGSPVLVPGLAPLDTEGAVLDEEEKSGNADASMGVNETKYHTSPELDEKQEPEGGSREEKIMAASKDEEEQLDNQLHIQKPLLAREQQPAPEHFNGNVLQTDARDERHAPEHFHSNVLQGDAREEQPAPETENGNILQSDVQWGRKTLQKLLNSLGFQ